MSFIFCIILFYKYLLMPPIILLKWCCIQLRRKSLFSVIVGSTSVPHSLLRSPSWYWYETGNYPTPVPSTANCCRCWPGRAGPENGGILGCWGNWILFCEILYFFIYPRVYFIVLYCIQRCLTLKCLSLYYLITEALPLRVAPKAKI